MKQPTVALQTDTGRTYMGCITGNRDCTIFYQYTCVYSCYDESCICKYLIKTNDVISFTAI